MGEKLSRLSKKDIAPVFVVGATTITVVYAVFKIFEHLKDKADDKKRAELERLQKDIESIPDPSVRLIEAGLALKGQQDAIKEVILNEPGSANLEAMRVVEQNAKPTPARQERKSGSVWGRLRGK